MTTTLQRDCRAERIRAALDSGDMDELAAELTAAALVQALHDPEMSVNAATADAQLVAAAVGVCLALGVDAPNRIRLLCEQVGADADFCEAVERLHNLRGD